MPITTEVEIESVKTASWIVGSNPFGGSPYKLAGYIVHVASPKFICKYVKDDNISIVFFPESDDSRVVFAAFEAKVENLEKIEFNTITLFDIVWLDFEPAGREEKAKLFQTAQKVIEIFISEDVDEKGALIQKFDRN